jgi:hypothetical protein
MNQTTFNKSDLIEAFIEAQRTDHPHKDFEQYHKRWFEVLQQAFGIEMSTQGIPSFDGKVFFLLFNQTCSSYLRLTARDGVLEGGLLEKKIEELGELGVKINQKREKIWDLERQNRETHLEILHNLFDVIWSSLEKTVTIKDLNALGFNLQKPEIHNYWGKL